MKNVLILTARKEETAKKIYDELESRRIADSLTKKPLVGGRYICTPYISILCANDMPLIASKSTRFDRIFVLEPSHCSDNLLLFLQDKTYQSIIIMPSFLYLGLNRCEIFYNVHTPLQSVSHGNPCPHG